TVAAAGCPGPALLRRGKDGLPFVTDGGHLILDAAIERIPDPPRLASMLAGIPGVVEHGLFIDLVRTAYIAGSSGVQTIEKS
ncbi:MAG: ribose-5-phosphate isomerase A, partial [Xanthobacteraceae bacterium]